MAQTNADSFRDDIYGSEIILHTLKSAPSVDPSITWAISLGEVFFLTRSRDFTKAFTLVEQLLASITDTPIDPYAPVHVRIRLLNAKARIFITAGRPQKALSIILRAAAAAQKAKAMLILWETIALLMQVLCSMKRFKVAINIGLMYVEQVRATKDKRLLAEMQLCMSRAYAGSTTIENPADVAEQHHTKRQGAKDAMLIEAGNRAEESFSRECYVLTNLHTETILI
jgi:anaphase-promoting complex subunit 5